MPEDKMLEIAKKYFGAETLKTQNSGDDFHEVAVWNMVSALQAAYEAGKNSK